MRIAIIGAGATGLTAAYELGKLGHRVDIYEREKYIGGLAVCEQVGDVLLEKFYHHIFTSDTEVVDMAETLGLGSKLLWLSPSNGICINSKLYPFTSPKDLLFLSELSLWDRFSLGLLVLKAKRIKDWIGLENLTVREWMIKTAGPAVWEKFWRPLLVAKFDKDADNISATWLGNKIKLRGSTRGKNPNRELLGYMAGGFQLIWDKLAEKIKQQGGRIFCSRQIKEIVPAQDKKLSVEGETYDAVLNTAPPPEFVKIVPSLASEYSEIRYKSNVCLRIEMTQQVCPFYWTSIAQDGFPFVAMIEHTNLTGVDGYHNHILYLSRYIDQSDELYHKADEEVKNIFVDHLKRLFPKFDQSIIVRWKIGRANYAQPVIVTGYSKILPKFQTSIPNLYLATMAQIYPEDRGMNYAIKMGKQIAGIINAAT